MAVTSYMLTNSISIGYLVSLSFRGRLVPSLESYSLECDSKEFDSRELKSRESDFVMFGILRKC